jgi:hypothetical protein
VVIPQRTKAILVQARNITNWLDARRITRPAPASAFANAFLSGRNFAGELLSDVGIPENWGQEKGLLDPGRRRVFRVFDLQPKPDETAQRMAA